MPRPPRSMTWPRCSPTRRCRPGAASWKPTACPCRAWWPGCRPLPGPCAGPAVRSARTTRRPGQLARRTESVHLRVAARARRGLLQRLPSGGMGLRRVAAITVATCLGLPVAALGATVLDVPPVGAAVPTDLFFSEYIEGTGFNKAVEIFNGTGAAVDLAAGGYTLELYSNGSPTVSQSVGLTGTVADGDVFVVSRADADPVLVAQADQLAPAVANWNGDDAVVLRKAGAPLDVIGQIGVDPGTEWGTGLTSTADNTLRRIATISAGDADGTNAFDPAAEWEGFAVNTLDGFGSHTFDPGGGNQPIAVTCGAPLSTVAGTPVSRTVTATDPDGTVVDLDVTGVSPTPAAGTISRTAFTPASGVGGTASATVTVSGDVPAGTYTVALTATNDDASPQTATCTLTVGVQAIRTIGEVQGPVTD